MIKRKVNVFDLYSDRITSILRVFQLFNRMRKSFTTAVPSRVRTAQWPILPEIQISLISHRRKANRHANAKRCVSVCLCI